MPASHCTVLLTGFGPFPGAEHNASAHLASRLAAAAARVFPDATFQSHVLPVDWSKAPEKLSAVVSDVRPNLVLHFGVSARAKGFVLERTAVNAVATIEDDSGEKPVAPRLVSGGRATRRSTLPMARIHARLSQANLPVKLSDDAGRYLCNAILYHSLAVSRSPPHRYRTGFIHIPSSLSGAGPHGHDPLPGCPLNWDMALTGGLEILRACLTSQRRRR